MLDDLADQIVTLTLLPLPKPYHIHEHVWGVTVVLKDKSTVSATGPTPDQALVRLAEKLSRRATLPPRPHASCSAGRRAGH